MNSWDRHVDILFSNYYNLQSVYFELLFLEETLLDTVALESPDIAI